MTGVAIIILIICAVLMLGCAKYEPVVDLKASKNPGEMQVDWQQCEWLANKYDLDHSAETTCLKNRGHNVIGERKL
jgi:hypothetical protein